MFYVSLMILFSLPLLAQTSSARGNDDNPARLNPSVHDGVANGLWKYDAYPHLKSLDAHQTVTIADIKGPGQINLIHITGPMGPVFARSVVLEISFDGVQPAAVSVPLGDFFADGTGAGGYYSTAFMEKTPDAYDCNIPMPFQGSARITLRNDSDQNMMAYSYVEWQSLPDWDAGLGYFHASWQRLSFQLTPDTFQKFFSLTGTGKFIGRHWVIASDEPEFAGMNFVMEANNEFRVDGEKEPSINYLGSEDSFNFSWGWHHTFDGYKNGINFINFTFDQQGKTVFEDAAKTGKLSQVSVYRFRDRDAIHFRRGLELALNWTKEFRGARELDKIRERNQQGGGWVDYAITEYWYANGPKGQGLVLPPVGERMKTLLHLNVP